MKMSQKQLILEYLRRHGSITADEAQAHCGRCHRLAARISELRADGHNIITDNKLADGTTVNYAIYRLKEDKHE